MATTNDERAVWGLVRAQHGVITRSQLSVLGYSRSAIAHRVDRGRLHPVWRGVYAVGRPEVSRYGVMMAAVLACGEGALLSHETGAELRRVRRAVPGPIHISVPHPRRVRRPGIRVHERSILRGAADEHERIPVTSTTLLLIDLAVSLSTRHLEAAVNMADSLDLLDAERLRATLEAYPRVPGVAALRRLLDREAFRLTDSELERMFRRLVGEIGLVVETDSLRYHRTSITQRRDAARDHAHLFALRESVRFTHYQVAYERPHVRRALRAAWRKASLLRSSIVQAGVGTIDE